ncbi:MAG: hypothetical protein CMJ19_23695 [Phycisphaeraceae bacterium]|nr:hypothetical protein [Phycisphaeraceae bacterium]
MIRIPHNQDQNCTEHRQGKTVFTKQQASIRTALLLAVNTVLLVGLSIGLIFDYQRGLDQRLTEKQISLQEEAALLHSAVTELQVHGHSDVQRFIDHACARMQDAVSPGHHIVVRLDQVILQARTHHRASPAFARVIQQASKTPAKTGLAYGKPIIVGTESSADDKLQIYVSEFTQNVQQASRTQLLKRALEMAVLGVVLTLVVNLILMRLVTRPIAILVHAVRRIADRELGVSPPGFKSFELDFLSAEIRQMSSKLELAEKSQRVQMSKARRIQCNLLPSPAELHSAGIYNVHMPAEDVGGDFFDMKVLDDDRVVICMGDVTGHGVPAAMGAAMLKILFEHSSGEMTDPAKVLAHINRRFYEVTLEGDFATMFMGVLDRRSGRFVYASAGHEIGYVIRQNGLIDKLDGTGLLLGVDPEAVCEAIELQVHVSDRIVLLTDGLVEALSPEGNILGRTAIKQLLKQNSLISSDEQARKLVQLVEAHQDSQAQLDDITIAILCV